MPKLNNRLPRYRLHKASGQAVVTLNGLDHYLGTHGSEESKKAYNRKVTEWLASSQLGTSTAAASDLTIDEVFLRYWAFVTTYYVRDGRPTGEQHALHSALTPVVNLYGPTRAAEFGPLQLKAVREWMIKKGLSRKLINLRVNRIRRMSRWAVENGPLSPMVLHGLEAVSPLRKGRSEAPDVDPVRPLPQDVFDRTLPHVAPAVAAMTKLQWHTGIRPGEVVVVRANSYASWFAAGRSGTGGSGPIRSGRQSRARPATERREGGRLREPARRRGDSALRSRASGRIWP